MFSKVSASVGKVKKLTLSKPQINNTEDKQKEKVKTMKNNYINKFKISKFLPKLSVKEQFRRINLKSSLVIRLK